MSEYFEFQISKRNIDIASNYLEKHQESFNKHNEDDRRQALCYLKNLIGASLNLALSDKSCCSDDEFLYRFLYARKFKSDEAFKLLVRYLSYKKHNQLLLQNINIFDDKIQLALRDGIPTILDQRDRKGRKVILFLASNWDPMKYTLEDIYRSFLLTLDKLLECIQNQALGFVVIVDWTNFTFQKSCHISPKILKLMIEGIQDCFPAKFKAIHFIAQPWFIDVMLTVIKSFLQEKIKGLFKVHGTNLSSLHKFINKSILPPELGGEGSCVNSLDWYHYLLECSQTTELLKTYRLIEPAVYSKISSYVKNSSEKLNGSAAPDIKKFENKCWLVPSTNSDVIS